MPHPPAPPHPGTPFCLRRFCLRGAGRAATPLLATLLAACAQPGPPHETPPLPVPQTVDGAQAAAHNGAAVPTDGAAPGWVRSAALQGVLALALAHNRDLRMALHNVERARAQYGIPRADLLPAVTAQGQASRASGQDGTRLAGQLGFASYELDFWGRVRQVGETALAQFLRVEENRRSVQIALVADVAAAWLNLAASQDSLALAQQTLSSRQEAQALLVRMHELGATSALTLAQGEAALQAAHGEVGSWRAQMARARNALDLLAGQTVPRELLPPSAPQGREDGREGLEGPDDLAPPLADVLHPLPSPLPSRVLLARPDVQAAENQLRAMHANIGAARAALFPSINLTFNISRSGWNFGPRLNLPIFDGGRRRAAVEVAEADQRVALAAYEKAVQTAFREAADALADRAQWQARIAAQEKLVAATQESVRLARARFAVGVENHLTVLDAQRGLYAAQQALRSLRLSEQIGRITLWKVLGGPPQDTVGEVNARPAP